MAQMNRNVNLEEIDSDALFGIEALKNQTLAQKIVFFGSVVLGVLANVLFPLYFETPTIVCIMIFMVFLLIGVGFGCNYTEDMTYGKYLYFFFFKPTKPLSYKSTEDVIAIRKRAEEIKKEEEMMLRMKQQANPEEQRKLLMKMIAFVLILVIAIGAVFVYAGMKEDSNIHHTVNVEKED